MLTIQKKLANSKPVTGIVCFLFGGWGLWSKYISSDSVFCLICFLLSGGWDRDSVFVKVLILVFGYLYLSYLTSRYRADVVSERSQDECTHAKLLFQAIYSFLEMGKVDRREWQLFEM